QGVGKQVPLQCGPPAAIGESNAELVRTAALAAARKLKARALANHVAAAFESFQGGFDSRNYVRGSTLLDGEQAANSFRSFARSGFLLARCRKVKQHSQLDPSFVHLCHLSTFPARRARTAVNT